MLFVSFKSDTELFQSHDDLFDLYDEGIYLLENKTKCSVTSKEEIFL